MYVFDGIMNCLLKHLTRKIKTIINRRFDASASILRLSSLMFMSKLLPTSWVWNGLYSSERGSCKCTNASLALMMMHQNGGWQYFESFLIIYFTGDRLGNKFIWGTIFKTYRSIVNLRLSSSGQSKVMGTTSEHTSSINSSDNESTYLWWRVKLPWSASSWSHVHRINTMSTNIWLVCCHTRDWNKKNTQRLHTS